LSKLIIILVKTNSPVLSGRRKIELKHLCHGEKDYGPEGQQEQPCSSLLKSLMTKSKILQRRMIEMRGKVGMRVKKTEKMRKVKRRVKNKRGEGVMLSETVLKCGGFLLKKKRNNDHVLPLVEFYIKEWEQRMGVK
jgi:hypothetical protein